MPDSVNHLLTADDVEVLLEALRSSLQDTVDYAEPNDYDEGELEESVFERIRLLTKLGGRIAGISGKNDYLLSDTEDICQALAGTRNPDIVICWGKAPF